VSTKTIAAVVAGTGFEGRERTIRRWCGEGSQVELRREPNNRHDPNAIGVWLHCRLLFGLYKPWLQIGYVRAARAVRLAERLDDGSITVTRAFVRSFYAPAGRDHPRVSLTIEVTETRHA
jgi:hypothetical protein